MLPDQVPPAAAGCYADFFSRPALTMNFAARVIEAEQTMVIVGIALRNAAGGFDIELTDVTQRLGGLDEQASCAEMNLIIEELVRRAPEQYQWSYKRFKRPPVGLEGIY